MKDSYKKGLGFGLTSGIITTLGVMVGLNASTHSKVIVLTSIILIAFADSFSDAFGIHISEESQKKVTNKAVWESTFSTFIFKFIFAMSFIIPVLLFELNFAVIISLFWGLILISIFSYYISEQRGTNHIKTIAEHVLITIFVVGITQFIGSLI